MTQLRTETLRDKDAAVDFYEERYVQGYMDRWPPEKKRRIIDVFRSLPLPKSGIALDFGCGNGELTEVMRLALPAEWKIVGSEISPTAVENAKRRYPKCGFFEAGDPQFADQKYDLLFTHHVLEHVYQLDDVLDEIDRCMKPVSAMLHILPCGNAGSFEHGICISRKDGIDPKLENRFFFEDEGHVRRLTSERLASLWAKRGFALEREYYSNQYFGAINWITKHGFGFVRKFTDPSQGRDVEARSRLKKLRYKLLGIWCLRFPSVFAELKLRKRKKTARDYFHLACSLPLYIFSKPVDIFVKKKALAEWDQRKTDRNGSEMYLFFRRQDATSA